MSAIGGIYHFNEGAVDNDTLILLEDALSRRGPDGPTINQSAPFGKDSSGSVALNSS